MGDTKSSSFEGELSLQLYTPEQRQRRDNTPWTLVQGILAPLQFFVFLLSLALILRTMLTGTGYEIATLSIIAKTLILYVIMITGAIWEKVVFGQYLFAKAFFWEDVFSFLVLALHTAYLVALFADMASANTLLTIALTADAAYVINAGQFLLKLRRARVDQASSFQFKNGFEENQRQFNPQKIGINDSQELAS
ncbi:MAG: 2-vinyl bacteriochlorophyllide hydratase [Pseudomonadota bacterium]